MTDDESDYAAWLLKLGGDLMYPPWLIPQTLTIPQTYGIWNRDKTEGINHDAAVDVVNKARARKGLQPLGDNLPSCIRRRTPKEG